MATRSIHWFRKGQRLHDNGALRACMESSACMPLFCLDPHFLTPGRVGANRMRFLLESLHSLDSSLRNLYSSRLLVLRGSPEEILPAMASSWGVDLVTFEHDTEPYALERDAHVRSALEDRGVTVQSYVSHTLYDPAKVIKANGNKAPTSYEQFRKAAQKLGDPAQPLDSPESLPPPLDNAEDLSRFDHGIPTHQELGYDCASEHVALTGGEDEALRRLRYVVGNKDWVVSFDKPKTNPTQLFKAAEGKVNKNKAKHEQSKDTLFMPGTTSMSPYMKFGNMSTRRFYHEIMHVYRSSKGKHAEPPVSLDGQLLWRDFFYASAYGTPNFHHMEGNRLCKQIPWKKDLELLRAWEEGRTGFPWIDAAMVQLREQGWLHHLARHAVACFLTRGDLFVHWEWGRDIFEKHLIDADFAVNNGNWMWLSASAFFSQYFRVYSPESFAAKYDKEGEYVKHFLPQLRCFPKKYIFEPWKASRSVQEEAGCIIGKDYPEPIVSHKEASSRNKGLMAEAYEANKKGKGQEFVAKQLAQNEMAGSKRKREEEEGSVDA